MADQERLFNHYKECGYCLCPLPLHYEDEFCPRCLDAKLFDKVRDYIRANDVNEFQVADHFSIPVRKVKDWIKEGRIEYRESGKIAITTVRCQRCGSNVVFGTLCTKCLKLLNGKKVYGKHGGFVTDDQRMHYLNENNE